VGPSREGPRRVQPDVLYGEVVEVETWEKELHEVVGNLTTTPGGTRVVSINATQHEGRWSGTVVWERTTERYVASPDRFGSHRFHEKDGGRLILVSGEYGLTEEQARQDAFKRFMNN